jgi:hypothetical protein
MKNNSINNHLIYIFLIFILFLLIIFLLFDKKNIEVQKYLPKIQKHLSLTKQKYPNIINPSKKIIVNSQVIYIENILNQEYFKLIKRQFMDLNNFNSRNIIGMRKADGLNFINLHKNNQYLNSLEIYYNNQLNDYISSLVHKPLQRSNSSDINACSLLIYSQEGDHITWHIDNSIYYGDRYVVLLTIMNENNNGNDLSSSIFYYKLNGKTYQLKAKPNSLLIFKGSEIWHKASPIKNGEKRVLLSMTFCDICQEKKNIINYIHDKIKSFVIYGNN